MGRAFGWRGKARRAYAVAHPAISIFFLKLRRTSFFSAMVPICIAGCRSRWQARRWAGNLRYRRLTAARYGSRSRRVRRPDAASDWRGKGRRVLARKKTGGFTVREEGESPQNSPKANAEYLPRLEKCLLEKNKPDQPASFFQVKKFCM